MAGGKGLWAAQKPGERRSSKPAKPASRSLWWVSPPSLPAAAGGAWSGSRTCLDLLEYPLAFRCSHCTKRARQCTSMEILTARDSQRRATSVSSARELAHGSQLTLWGHASRVPGRGRARGSAPSIPWRPCAPLRRACSPSVGAGSGRCRWREGWRLCSRLMPAPDAVAVRVRATVCRRNLVDGVLHRALTRAVPMTVRRSARGTPATGFGGGVPAHSLSRQRCQKLGAKGGAASPRQPPMLHIG